MLKYIRKVPIENYSVEGPILDKIAFPIMTDEILNIMIKDEVTGEILTYKDDAFAGAANKKANENEAIYILFIPEPLKDIEITLKISQIYQYTSQIKDVMKLRAYRKRYDYGFGGSRIDVMDRTFYINKENQTKYMIIIRDLFYVDTNEVVISDVRYSRGN